MPRPGIGIPRWVDKQRTLQNSYELPPAMHFCKEAWNLTAMGSAFAGHKVLDGPAAKYLNTATGAAVCQHDQGFAERAEPGSARR